MGEPHIGHGWLCLPWAAMAGWNAVILSGKGLPNSARRHSDHSVRERRVTS